MVGEPVIPYYQDDSVTIYHGDSFELVPDLRPRVDALVTDPPFVFSVAMSSGNYLTPKREPGNAWSDADVMGRWFASALDVFQKHARGNWSLCAFCSPASYPVFFPHVYRRFDKVTGLVWDKGRIGTGARWRRSFELILYAYNEGCHWDDSIHDRPDVLAFPPAPNSDRGHPIDKPTHLLAYLLEPITARGDLVLDPFMGGGSTLLAAKQLGRRAIGIESEERYCEIAATRLSQEMLDVAV